MIEEHDEEFKIIIENSSGKYSLTDISEKWEVKSLMLTMRTVGLGGFLRFN